MCPVGHYGDPLKPQYGGHPCTKENTLSKRIVIVTDIIGSVVLYHTQRNIVKIIQTAKIERIEERGRRFSARYEGNLWEKR